MGEWVRNVVQEQHATPSQKQQALEQAIRDASDGIRKREWGKLQGKVQAARGAVAHAQRQYREATTAAAEKEWQERTARAKREAAEATLHVQQAWRRRRAGKLAENEMDSAAVISKLLIDTGLIETSKTHFYGRAAAGPSFSEGILRTFTAPRPATSFY